MANLTDQFNQHKNDILNKYFSAQTNFGVEYENLLMKTW